MLKTKAYQARGVENWIKATLLSELIPEHSNVMELYCSNGADLGKWQRAKISHYIGIDTDAQVLQEAKKNWQQRKEPFAAEFFQHDILLNPFAITTIVDHVACFNYMLEMHCSGEEDVHRVLQFVHAHVHSGGYFVVQMYDTAAIWSRLQKQLLATNEQQLVVPEELQQSLLKTTHVISSDLFALHIGANADAPYAEMVLRVKGEETKPIMLHWICTEHVLKHAKSIGFEFVAMPNYSEYYQDQHVLYGEHLAAWNVFPKQQQNNKLQSNQMELLGLFCLLILKKK